MSDAPGGLADRFAELCDASGPEREERLAELRRTEPELAALLARMLDADRETEGPLERLEPHVAAAADRIVLAGEEPSAPAQIGAWKLAERLGVGGMGAVWRAERTGFAQQAAVKLIRAGMASPDIALRFELERQILARLSHPSIAKVLDGGTLPDGRPWFAMELVDGEPITDFVEKRGLPLERTLALFASVCDAVDFAHRNLVVHRDLKPANVLVTPAGEPKLLDFGLAKILAPDLDPGLTRTDVRALTPAYAAPEQVSGGPITTATDVYALGVVLYRLLTGSMPHRRAAPTHEGLLREIALEAVERPSSRVRSVSRRGARRLAGDLDTIVLRALEPDPARRYASASALAGDVRHHLAGRPIVARPDTLRYRAAKFVRRHKPGVAAAAVVALALAGGLAAFLAQDAEARAATRRAERVKSLLVDVFLAADPERAKGGAITARELLEEGTRRVEKELGAEPEVQVELYTIIARVEEGLGLLAAADRHARKALAGAEALYPARDARLLEPLSARGSVLSQLERDGEALALLERALGIARDRFAADSLEVARAETDLASAYFGLDRYAEALPLVEHALAVKRARLGDDHLETIRSKLNLAFALDFLDRTKESLEVGREVLDSYERAVGPDDPRTLEAAHNQAVSLAWAGRNEEALALFSRAIEGRRRVLGASDFRLGFSLQQSSFALRDLERYEEADRASNEAIAIFRAIDPGHPEAANGLASLATSDLARGDHAAAEKKLRSAVEEWRAARGPEHRSTLQGMANRALALSGLGRTAEAEALARTALEARRRIFGEESAYAAHSWLVLGEVTRRAGRAAEAADAHRRSREIAAKVFGEAHVTTVRAGIGLALDLLESPDPATLDEARSVLARAAAGQRKLDAGHSRMGEIEMALARLHEREGRRAEALASAAAAKERFERRLGPASDGAVEAGRMVRRLSSPG